MSQPERVCSECGSDRYRANRFEPLLAQVARLQRDAERMARENGLMTYRLRIAEANAQDARAGLQRKITRQARVIARFEERWRTRGERPWEGAKTQSETAPGAEYDATERA